MVRKVSKTQPTFQINQRILGKALSRLPSRVNFSPASNSEAHTFNEGGKGASKEQQLHDSINITAHVPSAPPKHTVIDTAVRQERAAIKMHPTF